jgi:hypothetical protein
LPTEPLVLGFEVVNPSLEGLAVGTPDRFHTRIIRTSGARSCADGWRGMVQLGLGALIKYRTGNRYRWTVKDEQKAACHEFGELHRHWDVP